MYLCVSCWIQPIFLLFACLFSGAVWISARVGDGMHQQLCCLWQFQIGWYWVSFTSDKCGHCREFVTFLCNVFVRKFKSSNGYHWKYHLLIYLFNLSFICVIKHLVGYCTGFMYLVICMKMRYVSKYRWIINLHDIVSCKYSVFIT